MMIVVRLYRWLFGLNEADAFAESVRQRTKFLLALGEAVRS